MSENGNVDLSENNAFYTTLVELVESQQRKCLEAVEQSEDELNASKLIKYCADYKIGFGKYAGYTVGEVLETEPHYLLWCIINLYHFAISNWIMMNKVFLKDELYLKALEINLLKNKLIEKWEDEKLRNDYSYDNNDYEKDSFDAMTDGQLGDWDDFNGGASDARDWMNG